MKPAVAAEGFRRDINGLRGLSVLMVVAFHLHLRGSDGGFIGVDVFFAISGFLMTQIIWRGLETGRFGYGRFVLARAARIWPALATLLAVLFIAGLWWLPPFDLVLLAEQSLRALVFGSNHYFLERSGYNTETADTNWLLHTWSLSVEWQFYLLYPLLLWGLARLSGGRRAVVAGALLVLAAASLACQAAWGADHPARAFFLLPARAWELLAGGLAWLALPLWPAETGRRWRGGVALGGLAMLLASALWLGARHVPPVGLSLALVPPVFGTVLILWAAAAQNPVLDRAPLQWLGRWSYSIYLWHWPLIVGLNMTDAFLDHPRLAAAGVALASVVLGALSHHLVETAQGWRRPLRLGLAFGAVGATAFAMVLAAGLPQRAPQALDVYTGYERAIEPLAFPAACSNFMKTAEATRICPVERGGGRRVIVIGDSHAEHLYPWFAAHSQVSVDFLTQAECPPIPNFERTQAGFHCLDYARLAWEKARSAAYDTVVVSARWAGAGLYGAPYCHSKGPQGPCVHPSVAEKQVLIRDELQAAVRSVLAAGKTVVMMAPTPEARVRVPERISRENFWFGHTRLQIDEASMGELAGWLSPLFDSLNGQPGFHLVSLKSRLCAGTVCKVYDAELKRPVYLDESHFDPLWIARHGGVFEPFTRRP